MYLHPLFTPLSQADRDALRDATELLTYKRNQLVRAAGEPCQHVYCVATGLLRVARHSRESSEEVTTDYALFDSSDDVMECRCGTPSCRKVIHGQDWRRPDLQDRYRGYFSRYLADRIQ